MKISERKMDENEDYIIRKIKFKRALTSEEYKYFREHFGNRLLEEGERHVVVMFENGMDFLAFLVATEQITMEQVTMTQLVTGVDIRDIEDSFTIPLRKKVQRGE